MCSLFFFTSGTLHPRCPSWPGPFPPSEPASRDSHSSSSSSSSSSRTRRSSSSSSSRSSSSRRPPPPPPYQPPLLPTLLRARSFYSVFTVRSSSHTTSSCLKIHFATLINSASDLGQVVGGLAGGGGGAEDDDDIGTQTPRTISPQEPFYSVFTVLS